MAESRVEDVSSSLATTEDIRKRLVRPPSLLSQPSSSSVASHRYSVNTPPSNSLLLLYMRSQTTLRFEGAVIRSSVRLSNCVVNKSLRFNQKIRQNSPKFDANLSEQQKRNRDVIHVKGVKRLEDYLDPFLLSTIRARIRGKEKIYGGNGAGIKNAAKSEGSDFDRFERSGDHHGLNSSTEGSRGTEESRAKPEERNDVVDLKIDCDSIGLGVDEDEQAYCTPFQHFERNALKRFKH